MGNLVPTYVPVFHSYFSLLSLSYKWVGSGEGEGRSLKYSQDLLFTIMDFQVERIRQYIKWDPYNFVHLKV